jgi:hypothetical protein
MILSVACDGDPLGFDTGIIEQHHRHCDGTRGRQIPVRSELRIVNRHIIGVSFYPHIEAVLRQQFRNPLDLSPAPGMSCASPLPKGSGLGCMVCGGAPIRGRHPRKHSHSAGEPNLCQLLINLQPGKGFYQVIIGASYERSMEFARARVGRREHNNPGVFDRLMTQTSHELQAVYFVNPPINQDQIRGTHHAENIHGLVTIVRFGDFEAAHGEYSMQDRSHGVRTVYDQCFHHFPR